MSCLAESIKATHLELALVVVLVRLEVGVDACPSAVRLLDILALGLVLLLLLLALLGQLGRARPSHVALHRVRARRPIALDARHDHPAAQANGAVRPRWYICVRLSTS